MSQTKAHPATEPGKKHGDPLEGRCTKRTSIPYKNPTPMPSHRRRMAVMRSRLRRILAARATRIPSLPAICGKDRTPVRCASRPMVVQRVGKQHRGS